jgi:TctA family transporter
VFAGRRATGLSPPQALTIGRGDVRELWASGPAAVMLTAAVLALVAPLAGALRRRI